jgi:hypothetical protein
MADKSELLKYRLQSRGHKGIVTNVDESRQVYLIHGIWACFKDIDNGRQRSFFSAKYPKEESYRKLLLRKLMNWSYYWVKRRTEKNAQIFDNFLV